MDLQAIQPHIDCAQFYIRIAPITIGTKSRQFRFAQNHFASLETIKQANIKSDKSTICTHKSCVVRILIRKFYLGNTLQTTQYAMQH